MILQGKLQTIEEHSHHALQVFISQRDNIELNIEGEPASGRFIIIDSNIRHSVKNNQKDMISILIDRDSGTAVKIASQFLLKRSWAVYSEPPVIELPVTADNINSNLSVVFKTPDVLPLTGLTDLDPRILKVIMIIDNLPVKQASLVNLAGRVGLSESRLLHLFKKETGTQFRRYLLWRRLGDALELIFRGKDITWAAYESGFSDSAHLSRTFKENFGISASKVIRYSRFIQFNRL